MCVYIRACVITCMDSTSRCTWQPPLAFPFETAYSRIHMTGFVRAITGTAYPRISIRKTRKAPCYEFIHTCSTCIHGEYYSFITATVATF